MVSLPRTCEYCGSKMHHYGCCVCDRAQLNAIRSERRALEERLARLDVKENELMNKTNPPPHHTEIRGILKQP